MSQREQLLAQLRDIHLPTTDAPAGLAGGPLIAIIVAMALGLGIALFQRWRRRRLHAALAELRRIGRQHRREADAARLARELAALLRRQAVRLYPALPVAGMVDDEWLTFLDAHGGGGEFRAGAGALLASLPYRPPGNTTVDAGALMGLTERWLRANPG